MTTPAWRQVPDRPSAHDGSGPVVLAAFIAAAGPMARASALTDAFLPVFVVAAAAVTAAVVLQRTRFGPWWIRGAVTFVAASAALAATGDAAIASWVLAGSLLSLWATRGTPPIPGLPEAGPGAGAPAAVLSGVAALAARRPDPSLAMTVPLVLSFAVPLLSRFGGGAIDRAARRFGSAVGYGVSFACFSVLGIVAVVLPWAIQRPLRIDPLRPVEGWSPRRRRSARASSPWASDSLLEPRPAIHAAKTVGLTVALVAVLVAVTPAGRDAATAPWRSDGPPRTPFLLSQDDFTPESGDSLLPREPVPKGLQANPQEPGEPFAAHAGDPWFESGEYSNAGGLAFDPKGSWRPVSTYRMADLRSRWINIVDGRRVSWTPPPCDCRRLTVWMYGGSTTWGLDQRDEYTIASELARVADENGLTVDVENRGNMGYLHWMEAERFAWDLTFEDPPDLVLFYDGVNDEWAANALNDRDTGDIKPLLDPTTIDVWNSTGRPDPPAPVGPPGSRVIPWPGKGSSSVATGLLAVRRYDQARVLSRRVAEVNGIPVRYAWQPSRRSRPVVPSEPHYDEARENDARLVGDAVTAALPDDVIDLTDVFDDTTEPLFVDDVHHNEKGARIVAEALYARLAADLTAIAKGKD